MLIIGIPILFAGVVFLCWLMFALAVYALPVSVGVTAGLLVFHAGTGPLGAIAVGFVAAVAVAALGPLIFNATRSRLTMLLVGLAFAAPAAVAGYHVLCSFAAVAIPAEGWGRAFAIVGAIVIGAVTWSRLSFSPREEATSKGAGSRCTAPDT